MQLKIKNSKTVKPLLNESLLESRIAAPISYGITAKLSL